MIWRVTIRDGWRGRFFEDFEIGDVYEHTLGRTITTADNIWFTLLTQNTAPIHFRPPIRRAKRFGKRLWPTEGGRGGEEVGILRQVGYPPAPGADHSRR